MLICKNGTFINNKHKDIDREFVIMFTVMDENHSWLLDENIKEYCPQFNTNKEDADFQESNKMHVINGYFYGNTPNLDMCTGDKVNWHMFGMGTEVDIHTGKFYISTFIPCEIHPITCFHPDNSFIFIKHFSMVRLCR